MRPPPNVPVRLLAVALLLACPTACGREPARPDPTPSGPARAAPTDARPGEGARSPDAASETTAPDDDPDLVATSVVVSLATFLVLLTLALIVLPRWLERAARRRVARERGPRVVRAPTRRTRPRRTGRD